MYLVSINIPYALISYLSINVYITCIVHDLGALCHKMLQMTLPMGLYRRWEASRDPQRHLHLSISGKSVEGSRDA